jgi:SAM-dependent methyltransferase
VNHPEEFEQQVTHDYTGSRGKEYHNSVNLVPDNVYPWIARRRREKILPFVGPEDAILEYGVGTGWNIAEISCRTRMGYDISTHLGPIVKKYGIEFIADITDVLDESLDLVICHHVLEHVPHPSRVLQEARRITRSGGKLLLFVPYEIERRYRKFRVDEPNHHLYSWNVQTLGNLVTQCGFRVIRGDIRRFGYDRFAGVWANRFHMGEKGYRMIQRMVHLLRPMFEVAVVAERK